MLLSSLLFCCFVSIAVCNSCNPNANFAVGAYNTGGEINLKTTDGTTLEVVDDFKYLSSGVNRTKQDIKTRKALAWKACNMMSSIWKTTLPRTFKVRSLSATVESVLLYGCKSWTLTQKLEKMLDGCYTWLLRWALNISWKDHVTNEELYDNIPKISQKIWKQRLNLVGHCYQHKEEAAAQLILWRPKHGKKSRGWPAQDFAGTLAWHSGIEMENLGACMMDRTVWRGIIARVSNPPWQTDRLSLTN